MSEEEILAIIQSHESLTFPNGVGSSFRCVESDDYQNVAHEIFELINRRFYNPVRK